MFDRPTLHRLGAWLARSRGSDATPAPGAAGVGVFGETPSVLTLVSAPTPDGAIVPVCPTAPPSAPLDPHHERGLHMAEAHRWNWAQRELERATRQAPDGLATADLVSVREVRRQLRVLHKWPRDVPALLALGRCYFELGLGADAEATFLCARTLAPDEPTAPYFLALEYAFRGERAVAEGYYARARALAPELPSFAECLGEQGAATSGEAPKLGPGSR